MIFPRRVVFGAVVAQWLSSFTNSGLDHRMSAGAKNMLHVTPGESARHVERCGVPIGNQDSMAHIARWPFSMRLECGLVDVRFGNDLRASLSAGLDRCRDSRRQIFFVHAMARYHDSHKFLRWRQRLRRCIKR
jgi:hypothetical protein